MTQKMKGWMIRIDLTLAVFSDLSVFLRVLSIFWQGIDSLVVLYHFLSRTASLLLIHVRLVSQVPCHFTRY